MRTLHLLQHPPPGQGWEEVMPGKTCSPDETQWNPGVRTYAIPDYVSLHPGYKSFTAS